MVTAVPLCYCLGIQQTKSNVDFFSQRLQPNLGPEGVIERREATRVTPQQQQQQPPQPPPLLQQQSSQSLAPQPQQQPPPPQQHASHHQQQLPQVTTHQQPTLHPHLTLSPQPVAVHTHSLPSRIPMMPVPTPLVLTRTPSGSQPIISSQSTSIKPQQPPPTIHRSVSQPIAPPRVLHNASQQPQPHVPSNSNVQPAGT